MGDYQLLHLAMHQLAEMFSPKKHKTIYKTRNTDYSNGFFHSITTTCSCSCGWGPTGSWVTTGLEIPAFPEKRTQETTDSETKQSNID
jgi:hypothetical protein